MAFHLPPPGFRSPSRMVRGASLVLTMLATLFVLTVAAEAVGLPDGYARAQSASGSWLSRQPTRWAALRQGTVRDMALYVPLYLAYGGALMMVISPPRHSARPGAGWRTWIGEPRWVMLLSLVGVAVADLLETLLFRASLTRLLGGASAAGINGIARATQVMSGVKGAMLVLTLALLWIHAVQRDPPS